MGKKVDEVVQPLGLRRYEIVAGDGFISMAEVYMYMV